MAPWGLAIFLIGILYGALAAGKQNKSALFKRGLLIGLVVGLALALLGFFGGFPVLGVGGFLAVMWSALVLSILFILGVWLGDLFTGAKRRA